MPKVKIILYPGQDLKELIKNHIGEGKKFPIAASLFFEDDKDKSGFTFFDEVTFKAGTKVGLTGWANLNKNQKEVLSIDIEPFESWYSKQTELANKKSKPKDTDSESSFLE